ncbi:MAG TPA: hypothetical protein VMR74_16455 [Gammaproteobacteria bacterium]|nr:hypothetical protein [Gammaproteobacteria bacterium]
MYYTCESNNTHDYKIVAVVQLEEGKAQQSDVMWAKRYELGTEQFVEIPTQDVACVIEGLDQ